MLHTTITGGCSGIGEAIVNKLLTNISSNEKILILDKDKEKLNSLEKNNKIIPYHIDLQNINEIYEFQNWYKKNHLFLELFLLFLLGTTYGYMFQINQGVQLNLQTPKIITYIDEIIQLNTVIEYYKGVRELL